MQDIFTLLLIGVLMASVVSFVVMGWRQWRRTGFLARKAHEMKLHFSAVDLFDVPRKYGDFTLVSNGHGQRACNVTHGYICSCPVRAFDLRYEVGHATRRMTRHYAVIAVQTRKNLGDLVMWHVDDAQSPPLAISFTVETVGKWICRGDIGLARAVVGVSEPLSDRCASVEVRGDTMMFCLPVVRRRQDYTAQLACIEQVLGRIEDYCVQ